MTPSRADTLALRRRLLVLDAAIQRLRLRRDAHALAEAVHPATLAWRWLGHAGGPRLLVQAFALWQVWRRLGRRS